MVKNTYKGFTAMEIKKTEPIISTPIKSHPLKPSRNKAIKNAVKTAL